MAPEPGNDLLGGFLRPGREVRACGRAPRGAGPPAGGTGRIGLRFQTGRRAADRDRTDIASGGRSGAGGLLAGSLGQSARAQDMPADDADGRRSGRATNPAEACVRHRCPRICIHLPSGYSPRGGPVKKKFQDPSTFRAGFSLLAHLCRKARNLASVFPPTGHRSPTAHEAPA